MAEGTLPIVLSIDPGTTNLGWAFMRDWSIVECGNDTIWKQQKPVRESLTRATVGWMRDNIEKFDAADKVLIELQYHARGAMNEFQPMIVMQTLFAACEYRWPGKAKLVHPQAVKNFFKIKGNYAERKALVSERYSEYLPESMSRSHDVLDAMLNCWYWREKNGTSRPDFTPLELRRQEAAQKLGSKFQMKPKKSKRKVYV